MRGVINDAMDIQAGSAICLGPRNIIAHIYQSIPISITVEGANILTRSMIIFGQGAIRSHPYIHAIMKTANTNEPDRAAIDFDRLLFRQIRFFLSNIARSMFSGLTNARLLRTPVQGEEAQYYRQLSRMSTAFALLTDVFILTLGAQLKRKEKISARLADILSELYIASCVLKHYQDQGSHPQDYPLVQWACDNALNKIQNSTIGLLQNYPYKPVAWLLKKIIFPLGTSFAPPSDKLGSTLAAMLLEPCPSRARLTQDIYIPHNTNDTLGRIESALTRVIVAEPVEATIKHAVRQELLDALPADTLTERAVAERIITPEQAELLHAATRARRDVIMVDEFSQDLKQHFDPVSGALKNNNNTLTPLDEVQDNVS
jgi:acyl-CoA dehydrogenase